MFLIPDKTIALSVGGKTLTVKQKIIPDSLRADKYVASYVKKGQPLKPCKSIGTAGKSLGITVHNTPMITPAKGTNAAEQYCRATYNGNMAGVVVHYYVWKNEVWQLLRLNERGWHATDGSSRRAGQRKGQLIGGNLDTVAIEAIGPDKATEDATALLCAWLCREFKLDPKLDIYQHSYFYPVKSCPAYIRPHWSRFIAQAGEYLAGKESAPAPDKPAAGPQEAQNAPALKKSDLVRVVKSGVPYYPGFKTNIPAWLKERKEPLPVTQTGTMGGVPAVLLGADIKSWIAQEYVQKI